MFRDGEGNKELATGRTGFAKGSTNTGPAEEASSVSRGGRLNRSARNRTQSGIHITHRRRKLKRRLVGGVRKSQTIN